MLIGHGYDIHKLAPGEKLVLGGVEIPHFKGFLSHSDGDVLIHAIIDSLLGAAAQGDIGKLFPDSDPKWKGANSVDLLKTTYTLIKNKGFKLINIDSTIVAEEPKLSPYIDQMRKILSSVLEVSENKISIKAKTNEGLDSIGKKEAICAWTVALIE